MTDDSLSLARATIELDGSFFEPEPSSDHVELDYYSSRTCFGVSSKEYHTTAKDILENIELSIGKRSVESLTEEEFDFYLNEQLQQVDLSDQHQHILRKKPGRAKKTIESQIDEDGVSVSKVVPTYSRQDTLTRRLTGQGFVQVDPQGSPPPREEKKEKRTSKFSKSELKKQSELKWNRCQPVLDRLENVERHLKYLLSVAKKEDYHELWNLRGDYELHVSDYKMLEKDTEDIKREWSSLPPVEGEDLMEYIDELHVSIKPLLEELRAEFERKQPSKKSSREKTIQEIRSECRDLYKQLVQLRSAWSGYCLLQPKDLNSWSTKRRNVDQVQQDLEMLREKFDHLKLKAEKEKMHWQTDDSFAEFTKFYRTFYNDYIIYQIIFVKEEFTKFPQARPNQEKAREAKSTICHVYIVRIRELQITLEELMSGKRGDSPETSQSIEELRKELDSIKKGVDALETEWIVIDVGRVDPVEDLSSLFNQLSHKLEESRIKIYRPPQRTKNLTKTEQSQVLETKKSLFLPYLDRFKLLRQQLSEILNNAGDETPEDVLIRQSKIQKLLKEVEDSKRQMDHLILEWKEVPVQGFNIENDIKIVLEEIDMKMKQIPRNPDGSFVLRIPKKDIPSEKVKAKEDLKVKYEELNRKLEDLRKLWMNYASEQPTDERTWKLKKKNIDKIQSDLDDLRKEFVKLRTGIVVEWEVLEGDPAVRFEELYRGLHDDYTAYFISFAKEEFTRFPQAMPNQEKAREAKFALCQPFFVRIRELQVAQDELMKGGKGDSPDIRKHIEELRKEMILVQKGVDALEMEWAGVDVGRSDPVEDLSRLFSQVSHKMEENRVKIYRPPQKTKKLTKEEQITAAETKNSLFQPYLDKMRLLKQQLLEAINSVSEQEAPEESLLREKKVQKISNELSNTKNHVDQLNLEWKGIPVEGLSVEEDITTLYNDATLVLKKIPRGVDGKFIIKKTIKPTQERPAYQHLLDKLSELCKQLNAAQQDKGDGSRKGQDRKKKKIKELEKEIEATKKSLDEVDANWRIYKVEGFDPFSNIGNIFFDFGQENKPDESMEVPTETKFLEDQASKETVKKPPYQHLLDKLSELSLYREVLSKENVKDSKQGKQRDKKLKEMDNEIEVLVKELNTLDGNWRMHPVKGFDAYSNVFNVLGDLIPSEIDEGKQGSQTSDEQKKDLLRTKNREYEPLLEKLSALQRKWNELGLQIFPKHSKLKKQRDVHIKEVEDEMDKIKEKLTELDEKWKDFEGDSESMDPVKAVSDLFLSLKSQLASDKEPDVSNRKSLEQKEEVYKPLLERMNEITIELEDTLKQISLPHQDENVMMVKKDRIKQLKDESNKLSQELEALESEWEEVQHEEIQLPATGTSIIVQDPSEVFKRLKEKLRSDFDHLDEIQKKDKVIKKESEAREFKKQAYDPLLKRYNELEIRLSDLLKPGAVNSEEELQARVETIQKLEKEIGDVKLGMDALDLEWKSVKVGDVDPIPATSELVKKFNESIQTIKLKLPKKDDIAKLNRANAEKANGVEKLKVYDPFLDDLKQLQIKINECGFHSPLEPALLKEKYRTLKELENSIKGAQNSLDMMEMKWMGREAKFEPGTLDPALDALQKLKKLQEEFYAVKIQAEKPREEVFKKKVDVYNPFKVKLNELLRRYSDLMASSYPVQEKFNLVNVLESELGDIRKEVSVLDENWKDIPMIGKDPSLEVSETFNSLVQQLQSARNNLNEERGREESLSKKEKAYQPLIEKLSALQRSCGDLIKSLDAKKDVKELEEALKKASAIEKDLNSYRIQLDKLELAWNNVPSKFDYDPREQCMNILTDLDGDLKKVTNNLDAKLKTFQDEMHLAKKVFNKEAESLENILGSVLSWDGLDNYQQLSKNFIHGQLVNVQNLESDVDAGLKKLETALSQTTQKLQDINSPEASKEIIAIKKRFDGLKDSTAKWLKKLEQKKNQLSSQLKNTNLEKESPTERSFNELQNYFMCFVDAKDKESGKPTSSISFSLENPDAWKVIQQYDKSLPKQMKVGVQESVRLVKQIESDSINNPLIKSSLNDIQVINQERASTLSPDLQQPMNQKHKVKPSSWKFNIPLDMTSKFTWLDHHWRELKGKLSSKDRSLHESNALAKEVFGLREKMYQAAKPLSECVDHLRMDFEIGSDVDPKEALKALTDVKKFHASLDAINCDLDNCLKACKPPIPEIDSSLYSDASKDLEANIGKLENELLSKPDGKDEADKRFTATLKIKLDEIDDKLKSLENGYEQHLSMPANKRLPNKLKELTSVCGDVKSSLDGLKKMFGWKLSNSPSFFQQLTLPHSLPHIELRLNNLKNGLSMETTKAQESDDQTALSSSHLQEYKKFLRVAEATLNEENIKTIFDAPQHLEKKINSLENLLNVMVNQRSQTELSISCVSPHLQQQLREEKKPLDDKARVCLEKGNKQLVLWLTFLSSWKNLLPQMQQVEQKILEKKKRAKLDDMKLSPKELHGKLKQLNEIKRELDDDRPKMLQTFSEAQRFLEEFYVPSIESSLQDSEKESSKLDSQVNDAINRIEEEIVDRDRLDNLLHDYDKVAGKSSKQLMTVKKLLNKKSPTVGDINNIQEVLHEAIKDINEADKLKSGADKAAQNLLSLRPDDNIELKLTKLDEGWKKLLDDREEVKESLGNIAPLALSKSQALKKLEEWLESAEKTLKEDDESKDKQPKNSDDVKVLLKKYDPLNSDLPLQKALLLVLGFSLPVDTTSCSSGSHKTSIPQIDSSVDSFDEGLGDSLEPSPKESFEFFQKFSAVSLKVGDRYQGLDDLENEVELLETEVKKFEKWIEGDAVKKLGELENELNKIPVTHLPHKVKEFEECLKAKEMQLADLTALSERIGKVTWPDASTVSRKIPVGEIKSRFIDLNGKLLELSKNIAKKSEIVARFNRHLGDCKALGRNARVRLQGLEKPFGIYDFQSFSLHLNDLKNLKSSYSKDFDERFKSIGDVVDQLKIVCDSATKTDIDKSISHVQSEKDTLMSDIDKYISVRESLQPDLVKFDELCCSIEEFIEEKRKQDFSVPPDDVRLKLVNDDVKKLQSMSKQLEDLKNDLSKKIDGESASNFLQRKSSIDPKVDKLLRRLKSYLDGLTANVPKISDSEIDDLEVFLSEKLEPRLMSVGREKFKDAAELKRAVDGLQLLKQEMQSQSLKLHAANESSLDYPLEAAAKEKLIKLNSRWSEGGTKLGNLVTVLLDKLALLQSFPERCKEWENYLNVTQKEFSEKKVGNLESALELQSKIKSFLDQVPSRHCTLQTLVSDADQLSNDVLNKKSIQTKLSLLEDQWRTLTDQLKKKDLATDGTVLLWRQYLTSKDNTSKAIKDLEKDVEGAVSPSDLTLSSLGWVKNQLEESQKILNSLETKHINELRALTDQLVPIVDSKVAKQVQSDTKDLTSRKEKLRKSTESTLSLLSSISSELEDLDRKIKEYRQMLDGADEEVGRAIPETHDGVLQEKSKVEKLLSYLEPEKSLQEMEKKKNALKSRGVFDPSSTSLLDSKVKTLRTGRDSAVNLLLDRFSKLQKFLDEWSEFDRLHEKTDHEIDAMNGTVGGGEQKTDLKNLLDFYANDFVARLGTLQSSIDELGQIGNKLKAACNDPLRSKVEDKLKNLQDKHKSLQSKTSQRMKHLDDAYRKLRKFDDEVPKYEDWLRSKEQFLSSPVNFATSQQAELDKQKTSLQDTESDINSRAPTFEELSKLADDLLSNRDVCPTKIKSRSISKVKERLSKRWNALQDMLPRRKHFLTDTESNWDAYKVKHAEFNSWLDQADNQLLAIIPKSNKYDEAKSARTVLKKFLEEVQSKSANLKKLNGLFGMLVSKLQIDQKGELKALNDSDNSRWSKLNSQAAGELRRLDNLINMRDDFDSKARALENFMQGLIRNLEQAVKSKQKKVKSRTSANARSELRRKTKHLENFDDSAKYLLEKADPSEKEEVSLKADHVGQLHTRVKELLEQLNEDIGADGTPVEDLMEKDDKAGRRWFFGRPTSGDAEEKEEDDDFKKLRQLEKWLDHAEDVLLKEKFRPFTLQDFKEALKIFKDLDGEIESWKPDVVEIRHSAPKVAQLTAKSEKLCKRISDAGHRWDEVCLRNKEWGETLDSTILNSDLLKSDMSDLDDLLNRLASELKRISDTPVDDSTSDLRIRQLCRDLGMVELGLDKVKPRLTTLRQLHNHARSSPSFSSLTPERASHLEEIGKHLDEQDTRLGFLCDGCLEERARLNRAKNERPDFKEDEDAWNELDDLEGVLGSPTSPSYWRDLLARGARTALPIQVLMLVLLGFASLVPICETNCFQGAIYSFTGGPPPT